jgi:ATP-binding cassette, subfamily B, bacterial PglK
MIKNYNKLAFLVDQNYKKNNYLFIFFLLISSFIEILSISIIFPSLTLILETDKIKDFEVIKIYLPAIYGMSKINLLILFIFVFLILQLLKSLFLIFFSYWRNNLVINYEKKIGLNLYEKYLSLSYPEYINSNSAAFSKNIVVETRKARQSYDAFMKLVNEIIIISSIILILIFFKPLISSIVILFFGFVGLSMLFLLKPKLVNLGAKQVKHTEKLFQNLNEGFGLFKEIKIRENFKFFIQKFSFNFSEVLNTLRLNAFISESVRILLEFITILFFCGVIYYLSFNLNEIKDLVPTLSLFGAAAYRFLPGLSRIIGYNQLIQSNQYAIDTILRDFNKPIKKYSSTKKITKSQNFNKSIEFKNVYFKYKNSDYIIKNLSFRINKFDFICLTGKSGEGKTTLIDLISGIIEPTKGKILVDGKTTNYQNNLKKNIGYIPQSVYLFDETIKNNILLECPNNKNRLNNVIKLSQLKDLAKKRGLTYKVGEKGSKLSGGQAQRLGIARSLYRSPSLLICDEISSSLDSENEKKIINSLKYLKNKLTLICVTHNPDAFNFNFIKKLILKKDRRGNTKLIKI